MKYVISILFCSIGVAAICAQPRVVKNLNGFADGVPQHAHFTTTEDLVIFSASDDEDGLEPWRSDGTPEGTYRLMDIDSAGGSNPLYFAAAGSKVFFTAYTASTGRELYVTDGEPGGTHLVEDIWPGEKSGMEALFVTTEIFGTADGLAFFSAKSDEETGVELFLSDGSSNGTFLLKKINAPLHSSNPRDFEQMEGVIYFTAEDLLTGRELYTTDGSAEGTFLFKDLAEPSATQGSSNPALLTSAGSKLYFYAYEQGTGYEPWVCDGTPEGTYLIKDIAYSSASGLAPVQYAQFMPLGNRLIFNASSDRDRGEIWVTDGTPDNTIKLVDLGRLAEVEIDGWTSFRNKIYFIVDTDDELEGVWVTDGTPEGTKKAIDLDFPEGPVNSDIITAGDSLIISATSTEWGTGIYASDGTPFGTREIVRARNAIFFGVTNDKLFFSAETADGRELWVYEFERSTSSKNISELKIRIYPNPATEYIIIDSPDQVALVRFEMYDLAGHLVGFGPITGTVEVPSGCTSGIYNLCLYDLSGQIFSQRICIMK